MTKQKVFQRAEKKVGHWLFKLGLTSYEICKTKNYLLLPCILQDLFSLYYHLSFLK